GVLYDMMIYDVSRGFENSSIILADSGKMTITPDKTHLFLRLWQGESFENLKDAATGMKNVPYRRESFDTKEIMLKFDANFNRMDEQGMRNQYVGKNMAELQATIDSVGERVDSLGGVYAKDLREKPVLNISPYKIRYVDGNPVKELRRPVAITTTLDIDSVFRGPSSGFALNYLNQALTKVQRQRQEYEFTALSMADDMKTIRRHAIELQKKFTLSFACIIFFFIGAPLGAIIRKGGLGTPLVISVLLFIFYYIIDNMGYKFARDGKLPVWQGMWLSAAVLLPLGIFFTYKAVNDSVVFNKDAYVNFFRRFFGVSETRKVEMKEVVMEEVRPDVAIERLATLRKMVAAYLAANPAKESYIKYWTTGYDRDSLMSLRDEMEEIIDRLSNSRDKMVIMKLMDYPVLRWLWFIRPAAKRWLGLTLAALFPIGIPVWIAGRSSQARLRHELETVDSVSSQITTLIENGKDKA
ncbi:MAG: LptF/LptG family permease, partial [Duncaniella sp.]|nr:LptF/LptG family permease [Duncaniella sp.]